ncbi:MAG: hypothetical protein C5B57_01695 [Blastocatellia bacterium]|nr:MAG: hypothetical protein C5B57_01695 [Blastocatellia bacterium]
MEGVLIVAVLFLLIWAATMTVIVWRTSRDERRRAAARIAVLAADLAEADTETPVATDLFRSAGSSPSSSRLTPVLVVGFFAVLTALALTVAASRGGHTRSKNIALLRPDEPLEATQTRAVTDSAQHPVTAGTKPTPLDLITLAHDRVGDGITIRGIVRNPPSGVEWRNLTAVVFLFNRNGQFLTSGRAVIGTEVLAPGAESTFVVDIPNAIDVGRYRVSFRTEDQIVPHHDRRDRGRVAQVK